MDGSPMSNPEGPAARKYEVRFVLELIAFVVGFCVISIYHTPVADLIGAVIVLVGTVVLLRSIKIGRSRR